MFDNNVLSKIQMNKITSPILMEMSKADLELKKMLNDFDQLSNSTVSGLVMQYPDRQVRQAMILLPSNAIGRRNAGGELYKLCAAAEIAYTAVRLHEGVGAPDIRDGKISGIENPVNDSLAVLSGDALNTLYLLAASEIFPKNLLLDIIRLIEKISYMKISDELQDTHYDSEESYIKALENRTAEFIDMFALLWAYVTKAYVEETVLFKKCAYSLAISYQIIADFQNGKIITEGFDPMKFIRQYTQEAKTAISGLGKSIYRKSLLKLVDYFYKYGHRNIMKEVAY